MDQVFAQQLIHVGMLITAILQRDEIEKVHYELDCQQREISLTLYPKGNKPIYYLICCRSSATHLTAEQLAKAMATSTEVLMVASHKAPDREFIVVKLGR